MTGPTHKKGSVMFALVANMLIYKFSNQEINYYICLVISLYAAEAGAIFPDIDHEFEFVKNKTPITWVLNKIIHITGGKHRSWQTHSIDIVLVMCVVAALLPGYLFNTGVLNEVSKTVLLVITTGFMTGWLSHIYMDMLTPAGVRIFAFSKIKAVMVPRKIAWAKLNTGGWWETVVARVTTVVNIAVGLLAMVYPWI